jgi:hypothetical protein
MSSASSAAAWYSVQPTVQCPSSAHQPARAILPSHPHRLHRKSRVMLCYLCISRTFLYFFLPSSSFLPAPLLNSYSPLCFLLFCVKGIGLLCFLPLLYTTNKTKVFPAPPPTLNSHRHSLLLSPLPDSFFSDSFGPETCEKQKEILDQFIFCPPRIDKRGLKEKP